jgi:hypothetical protein
VNSGKFVVPAPAAELRGAPRMAAWRNPTFWVLGLDVVLLVAGTYGYATGRWPAGVKPSVSTRWRSTWASPGASR